MDEDINLSLDEIIQKRKTQRPRYTDGPAQRGTNANEPRGRYRVENGASRRPVEDARLKIINNKRAKMRDARDQLVINRGRGRGSRYRWYRQPHQVEVSSGVVPATFTNGRNSVIPKHLKRNQLNRRYADSEYVPSMSAPSGPLPQYLPHNGISFGNGTQDEGENPFERMTVQRLTVNQTMGSLANATRTLHNDAFTLPSSMPPFPHFRTVRATSTPMNSNNGTQLVSYTPTPISSDPDPFDQYEVNSRPNLNVPPPPLPGGNRTPLRGILRTKPSTPQASKGSLAKIVGVPHNLSPSMRARLERTPNPNRSMGIFAHNSGSESSLSDMRMLTPSPPTTSITGYRIIVSNLHPNVSQIDIKELFEDIGDLLESRLVRPGVAEVIYRNLRDAEKAVDAYHNRQLDGQPMNCLLVNPRAEYKLNATNLKYGR
ncbi:uncharacterized protein LOC128307003 [Anopheles moucheti]|uniref:uncharacterized protein LOC128307003 n=1 Tax=Anopheles moucheti TaxID=186751 RepID=UPI0022F085AE|nr:uncharacterized protein LOC128307003 [Anopheles moucheti]